MTEHPDDILRALADPERLSIAGALARSDASATDLSALLGMPVTRVRKHLNRLSSAGVVRLNADRRTYRLDAETLRRAAEQVGPPRDVGMALGAANDDEEAVLRSFFRDGRLTEIPMKAAKRRIVLERIALEFEPGRPLRGAGGERDRRAVLQRLRRDPPLPRGRAAPRSRPRRVLAERRSRGGLIRSAPG